MLNRLQNLAVWVGVLAVAVVGFTATMSLFGPLDPVKVAAEANMPASEVGRESTIVGPPDLRFYPPVANDFETY